MGRLYRKFKRMFAMDNVEVIDNTHQQYPWLEANKYLLVEKGGLEPMLFTLTQVKHAQTKAKQHPEDI